MLQIRYSSPLFRLTSSDAIQHQVSFGNSGPDQVSISPASTALVVEGVPLLARQANVLMPLQSLLDGMTGWHEHANCHVKVH